jgi:hypothetical protein
MEFSKKKKRAVEKTKNIKMGDFEENYERLS